MGIAWSRPSIFSIQWENGSNRAASPLTEVSQNDFMRYFHCGPWGLQGLNYGGYAPLPDADPNEHQWWYSWHYYFFHREALAIATRYMKQPDDVPPQPGTFITKDSNGYGYDAHFYLLGCQHPNWKWDSPRMHDQHVKCPDCGFEATYDSSG